MEAQVSEINQGLNEQVEALRNRALEPEYPVLWIDALYEKIRLEDWVVNMAVLIVTDINRCGTREILAIEPMYQELEATYSLLFQKLKDRGLKDVWLVISDAHAGLQAAVRKGFLGASWQRCRMGLLKKAANHGQDRHFCPLLKIAV